MEITYNPNIQLERKQREALIACLIDQHQHVPGWTVCKQLACQLHWQIALQPCKLLQPHIYRRCVDDFGCATFWCDWVLKHRSAVCRFPMKMVNSFTALKEVAHYKTRNQPCSSLPKKKSTLVVFFFIAGMWQTFPPCSPLFMIITVHQGITITVTDTLKLRRAEESFSKLQETLVLNNHPTMNRVAGLHCRQITNL